MGVHPNLEPKLACFFWLLNSIQPLLLLKAQSGSNGSFST
jgi:hypothetical protein